MSRNPGATLRPPRKDTPVTDTPQSQQNRTSQPCLSDFNSGENHVHTSSTSADGLFGNDHSTSQTTSTGVLSGSTQTSSSSLPPSSALECFSDAFGNNRNRAWQHQFNLNRSPGLCNATFPLSCQQSAAYEASFSCPGTILTPFSPTKVQHPGVNIPDLYQSITLQPPCFGYSFEELRLADYKRGYRFTNLAGIVTNPLGNIPFRPGFTQNGSRMTQNYPTYAQAFPAAAAQVAVPDDDLRQKPMKLVWKLDINHRPAFSVSANVSMDHCRTLKQLLNTARVKFTKDVELHEILANGNIQQHLVNVDVILRPGSIRLSPHGFLGIDFTPKKSKKYEHWLQSIASYAENNTCM